MKFEILSGTERTDCCFSCLPFSPLNFSYSSTDHDNNDQLTYFACLLHLHTHSCTQFSSSRSWASFMKYHSSSHLWKARSSIWHLLLSASNLTTVLYLIPKKVMQNELAIKKTGNELRTAAILKSERIPHHMSKVLHRLCKSETEANRFEHVSFLFSTRSHILIWYT